MNIPLSWLQEFVKLEDVQEFADKMTMSGTKVEAIHSKGKELSGIVVTQVTSLVPHPEADKLAIATVTDGSKSYQMVTGAKNLKEGDFVPAAMPGSVLAGGMSVQSKEFRGQISEGMLCSIEELGYTPTDYPEAVEDGIYVFPSPPPLGSDACKALELKDDVIEFELTTNRPDCFCLKGIVREAAAIGYQTKEIPANVSSKKDTNAVKVTIENPNACFRYVARIVENVKIAPSPQWMRRRLTLSGVRPRNNIVDITNYVMLEQGQPLHAFDMDCVAQNHVVVRNAKDGEQLAGLDGSTHTLSGKDLVIADPTKALALAGVVGSRDSAISNSTTRVIFESANFHGPTIRQTSKSINLRTDASGRNEKGLDPNLSLTVVNRCMELIEQLKCGTVIEGWVDVYPNPVEGHTIKYSPDKINSLLGTDIDPKEMESILNSLEIETKDNTAYIPSFRKDIEGEADIAEEISRIFGYDKIPFAMDSITVIGEKDPRQKVEELILSTGAFLGLHQIMTYSFENPGVFDRLNLPANHSLRNTVTINNPLGENSIMKTTSMGGMLSSLSLNYSRRNMNVALFELTKIFTKTQDKPSEHLTLTIGMYSKSGVDFFYIKGIVDTIIKALGINVEYNQSDEYPYMHPGRTGNILLKDSVIGHIGQIHPLVCENYEIEQEVYAATINIEELLPHIQLNKTYTPLPKYPTVTRDIAFKIKQDVSAAQIEEAIKAETNSENMKIMESITLFDVYQGKQIEEGYKSMAYSITFRHPNRTLEDIEVNKTIENLLGVLKDKFNAELRG
ncbi:MAG: phenylalanine--tRNA ligase subunit beta [Defluviitaleaceae bacterium]|nr:phenylalanine--tRNA ligase subunit beta [Defluviitaleaceae bacterium]